jgi:N-methylhydantoinase A
MIPPLIIRDISADVGKDAVKSRRRLWFHEIGEVDAPIYDRRRMSLGLEITGPAVIESLESTILVPPQWQAKMSADGFVLLTQPQRGATR